MTNYFANNSNRPGTSTSSIFRDLQNSTQTNFTNFRLPIQNQSQPLSQQDRNAFLTSLYGGAHQTRLNQETFIGLSQELQRARANQGSRLFNSNSTANVPIQNTANLFNNNTSRFGEQSSRPSPFNNNPSPFGSQAQQSMFTNSVRSTFDVYRFAGAGASLQQRSILPNRDNIRGRDASFSTNRQSLAALNQSLNNGQSISDSLSRQPRTTFPVRPQTTGLGFQPSRQEQPRTTFPVRPQTTGLGFQPSLSTTVQQMNAHLNSLSTPQLNNLQILPSPQVNLDNNFASTQARPQFSAFPNPIQMHPQVVTVAPSAQLQALQAPMISSQRTEAPSFFVNNNPAPLEEVPQQEEEEEISQEDYQENVFGFQQQEVLEDGVESGDDEDGEEEDLVSFSEDLEALMINHQLKMPEGLFNNGAFMQNLTDFLQGYNIRPSENTVLCSVSEQEPEIKLQTQTEGKEEHVQQEGVKKPHRGRGILRRVTQKELAMGRRGRDFKVVKDKKPYQPGSLQLGINSIHFTHPGS